MRSSPLILLLQSLLQSPLQRKISKLLLPSPLPSKPLLPSQLKTKPLKEPCCWRIPCRGIRCRGIRLPSTTWQERRPFVFTTSSFRQHRLFNEVIKSFDSKSTATRYPEDTLLSDEWKHRVTSNPSRYGARDGRLSLTSREMYFYATSVTEQLDSW